MPTRAAFFVAGDYWHGDESVAPLIDAGADREAIAQPAEARGNAARGLDLGTLADRANRADR